MSEVVGTMDDLLSAIDLREEPDVIRYFVVRLLESMTNHELEVLVARKQWPVFDDSGRITL